MKTNRSSLASSLSIAVNADMARSSLRTAFKIDGESDAQIIRGALNRLPQTDPIVQYRDLVMLRWVTILIDQFPPDHPDFPALYKTWYNAKVRTREVI